MNKLYLSKFNVLHQENCSYFDDITIIEFKQLKDQSDINFLISTVTYIAKNLENSIPFEICPHCLGKRFNLLSLELNLFKN